MIMNVIKRGDVTDQSPAHCWGGEGGRRYLIFSQLSTGSVQKKKQGSKKRQLENYQVQISEFEKKSNDVVFWELSGFG